MDIHGHGGRAVLPVPDTFLQNIVSSVAQDKLTSVDVLKEETHWPGRRLLKCGHGAEVLDIVYYLYFPLRSE